MALTYAIEGKGVIANADATSDTAGGTWGFSGSGGVANGTTTDTYYYGNTSFSMALSGAKNGWLYHDIGAGNELDFSGGGTEEGQFVYVWVHCPTAGLTDTLANEGISIRIGSGTGAYRSFIIGGSNGTNGWDGGWQCFVIDPTKTGSIADTGTPNLASIRYIGLRGATTATAKGDNFFISQIAVGSGLRITGTSTTAWDDAVTYCTDLPNRAWGMLQEREGIYYAYGNIIIGDTTQTAATDFDDEGRVVQFGVSEYWSGTGTTFVTSLPTTACGITVEDASATHTTTFTDGVIVGTDNGRSGSTFIGNANENVFFDVSGLTLAGSDVNLYGSTFKSFAGAMTLEADTDHAYLGVNFIDCSQLNPVGNVVMKNCTFAETQDLDAAFLWNGSLTTTNFTDNSFIANTTGAAIEHPAQGTFSYEGLTFSGNTNDILYSTAASSGVLTINASDSNPVTSEIANPTGNSVSIVNTVTLTVTVKDQGGTLVDANVRIQETDGTLISQGATTSGVYTDATYNYSTDTAVQVRVRESSSGTTRYFPAVANGTIQSSGLTVEVTLIEDTIAST